MGHGPGKDPLNSGVDPVNGVDPDFCEGSLVECKIQTSILRCRLFQFYHCKFPFESFIFNDMLKTPHHRNRVSWII